MVLGRGDSRGRDRLVPSCLDGKNQVTKHPAKFSKEVLEIIEPLLPKTGVLLDPFGGTGKGLLLRPDTAWGVEIEPEWTTMHPRQIVGDATRLPLASQSLSGAFSSCTYGNRFSDHHNASDGSVRHSYTHTLGRPLHPRNTGQMPWGREYRRMHILAWFELWRVLRRKAPFVLNISNFIKNFEEVDVVSWHTLVLEGIGFRKIKMIAVETRRMTQGTNRHRVAHEYVIQFVKP